MAWLFVRFYLGVVLILLLALGVMAFAFQHRLDTDFSSLTARTMGEGVDLARQTVEAGIDTDSVAALNKLQQQFGYPIQVLSEPQIPDTIRGWLAKDADVVVYTAGELSVLSRLSNGSGALQCGPLALSGGVIETDMMAAVGAVLLLVALAIGGLLRPLARQLGELEQTAISIANGDLGARVDLQKANSARTLAQSFNEMAARTEALLRTQRELLQAVSHELRTPLARITFAIDLIRTDSDERDRAARLGIIETASLELDELVGELLQYVRLETGGPQPVRERLQLRPIVEELLEHHALISSGIQFEIGPDLARGDVYFHADPGGLVRVLSNLLANASRFSLHRVVVNADTSDDGAIMLDVDDDGPGIPVPDRVRVFEPFVRLGDTTRGAGLGLALVKRILANHGGSATALESPLGGCRIRTFWPSSPTSGKLTADSDPAAP